LPREGVAPPLAGIVAWHRADLRTVDNAALASAAAAADRLAPVFVHDPACYDEGSLARDARLRFLRESLTDLRGQYRLLGTDLALLSGDPRERAADLLETGYEVYCNRDVAARRALERDGLTVLVDHGLRWPDDHEASATRERYSDPADRAREALPDPRSGAVRSRIKPRANWRR